MRINIISRGGSQEGFKKGRENRARGVISWVLERGY